MATYRYSHIVWDPKTKRSREYVYHSRLNLGDAVYFEGTRWIVVSKQYQQDKIKMKDKILNAAFYLTVAAAVCMIIKAWSILLEVEWL